MEILFVFTERKSCLGFFYRKEKLYLFVQMIDLVKFSLQALGACTRCAPIVELSSVNSANNVSNELLAMTKKSTPSFIFCNTPTKPRFMCWFSFTVWRILWILL